MSLRLQHFVDLPEHAAPGGFDHAAVCTADNRLSVAHTSNDSLDVIDTSNGRFLHSMPGLTGVAGALVSGRQVFTSNRGENSVGLFRSGEEEKLFKVQVGARPNGLSYDPGRDLLLRQTWETPALPVRPRFPSWT